MRIPAKAKLINEARMNKHMTHFESLVMLGPDGLLELNDKIEAFESQLYGEDRGLNNTTKIDGSPAVFIWSKFPGYPDNSICLKSFIDNANNCMTSLDEIHEKYGDRPDMCKKLENALMLAKYIPEGECWQGDCLFTYDTLKEQIIDGIEYVTFQPNKIVYAIPQTSPSYETIKEAEFGIAFHTIYRDDGNGRKSQSFRVDLDRVQAPKCFYLMSVALNIDNSNDPFHMDEVHNLYSQLQSVEAKLNSNPSYAELTANQAFMSFWNTFENKKVADEKNVTLNEDTVIEELWDYIEAKQTAEFTNKLQNLKTVKGKLGAIDKWVDAVAEMRALLTNNNQLIVYMVQAFNLAAQIKMHYWEGFKNSYKSDYDQYYLSRTKGFIPADMEGIAMSDSEGNVVKIVDRTTFSSYNRDPDIMAGWEHPEDKLKEDVSSEEAADAAGEFYKRTRGLPYDSTPSWVKQGRRTRSLYDYDPEKEKEEIAKLRAWYKEQNKADRKAKFQKIKDYLFGEPSDTLGCGYADLAESKLKESYYSSSWSVEDTEEALQLMREFAEKHHTVIKLNRTRNKEAIAFIDGSDFHCTVALGDATNLQENINYAYHIFISGAKLTSRKDWWGFTIEEFKEDLEAFDSVYHFAETGLRENVPTGWIAHRVMSGGTKTGGKDEFVKCDVCGAKTDRPHFVNGFFYCDACWEQ